MVKIRWLRVLALVALLLTLIGGAIGPTGRTQASVPDCGDGHKWDDAQQMCVDQEPSDCVDGQVWDDLQQMCVASSTDNGGEIADPLVTPTEMVTVLATETIAPASLTVSVAGCPAAYDLSAAGTNPQNDCTMPVDGVQITYRVPDRPDLQPVQQPATGGTTTFAPPLPGPFTLDASLQPGASAPTNVAWMCQGSMSQPIVGTGMSIAGTIQDGEQMTCAFFLVIPQTTPTATPMVRQGIVAGQERGSIRIELSMCKQGFDPAASPSTDLSTVCTSDYNFGLYPITFTAFGTTHDTATVGVTDSFFSWVKWDDNLGPDTYRVEATLPTGISTILFEYCGDGGTVENGKITFLAPVTSGGLFACGLDAVRDPAAPTPTRVPRADSSTLAIVSAVCPAGFVPGTTETDPNRSCTGATAGISYNLSGPAGSPNSLGVAGVDNLSIRATPGVYHVAFTMPDTLASVAGARCTVYDLIESHWVDDVVLAPVTTGRDVAIDIDLPGAMLWTCMVFVVPTGPSPTPTPSVTPTATITPTPTVTMTATTMPQTQSGTTSQPPSQSQGQTQSGTNSQPQTSTTGQNAIVIGPQATSTTGASVASASPAGNIGIVIHAVLCPVGTEAGSEGTCLTTYRGAVFTVRGATTGISLQATAGEILPDAAVFTELPPDTYTITQQRAAGIAETIGSCELFAHNAQGMATESASAPVPVLQDTIQQVIDTNASVLACTWYSLPDASFPELLSPTPPQGVSLTVHAFTCPAGYDPANADANPAVDCLKPARGVAFSLAGATSGATTQLTTGADAADPKDGSSHSGTIAFTGLVADSYTLTQEGSDEPVNAFVTCSLATSTDAGVPVYPSVASGAITYQFNDNEALTCLWYVTPPAGAGETPAGPMQGGAADDDKPTVTPPASGGQGGATDDEPTDASTTAAGQERATEAEASAGAPSTIYLFVYQCPTGYAWDANDPGVGLPCIEQPEGVAISVVPKATGATSNQKTGELMPGGVMLTGLAADTYTFSITVPAGTTIEARPCDVTGATDGSTKTPVLLTFSETGSTFIALPADTTYACNWYLVPEEHASAVPASYGDVGDLRRHA